MTDAERQARRRAKVVTFMPTDKPALDVAAAVAGLETAGLVSQIVDGWLNGALPPSPMCADKVRAAAIADAARLDLLEQFACMLDQAGDGDLERIKRRVLIVRDMMCSGTSR